MCWSRWGLVQRIEVGDGAARFEPAHPSGEHHHHLLCAECRDVVAFEDAALERAIGKLGRRLDAVIEGHDVRAPWAMRLLQAGVERVGATRPPPRERSAP